MVTEKMAGWHPIHDNHAIAVVAAVVTFAQAIPDLLLKRVSRIPKMPHLAWALRVGTRLEHSKFRLGSMPRRKAVR